MAETVSGHTPCSQCEERVILDKVKRFKKNGLPAVICDDCRTALLEDDETE